MKYFSILKRIGKPLTSAALVLIIMLSATSCFGKITSPFPSDSDSTDSDTEQTSENTECTAHSFGEWEITKVATCAAKGESSRVCALCGKTESKYTDKLEHTPVVLEAKEPSCDAYGKTEGSKCSECGKILKAQSNIAKIDHSYENGTCTVCGDNMTSVFIFTKADDGASYVITGTKGTLPEKLTIPSTYNGLPVTRIDEYAIRDSSSLKELIFPDSLEIICRGAVLNCRSLTSVTLPFVSIQTFQGQRSLSSVFDSITLRSLKHVTISSSSKIMEYAFNNCPSLESIAFPADTKEIGYGTFIGCTNLKNVTVNPANEHYYVENNCLISYDGDLVAGCNASTIPTSGKIKSISPYAFAGCNFTEITIPQSVEQMGVGVFESCKYLTKITLPFVGLSRELSTYDHLGYIFGAYYPDQSDCIPTSLKEVTVYDCHSIYNNAFS